MFRQVKKPAQPTNPDVYIKESIDYVQSLLLTLIAFGLLEVGCLYTTLLVYGLMAVAFYEMIRVQQNDEKETCIQIKTKWVEIWYFITAQFYLVSTTWLT